MLIGCTRNLCDRAHQGSRNMLTSDHSPKDTPTEGEKDTGLGVAFNEKSASREFKAIQSKRGIPGQTSRCVRKQLT